MIELMLFMGVLLIIVVVWVLCGQVDNTFCLEFKESVHKRFERYARMEPYGDKLSRVIGTGDRSGKVLRRNSVM